MKQYLRTLERALPLGLLASRINLHCVPQRAVSGSLNGTR